MHAPEHNHLNTPGSLKHLKSVALSYIQAQQEHRANLDIFAEGSVMEPGTQGIYTLPDSPVATLADLKGQTVAINAPDNILFLLTASVLAEHGGVPQQRAFRQHPVP
jgi:ABC-type nitrate/sulfonate/bicarbonate transport system substrate-binding protein